MFPLILDQPVISHRGLFLEVIVFLSEQSHMYYTGLLPGADAAVWTVWPTCPGSQGPF